MSCGIIRSKVSAPCVSLGLAGGQRNGPKLTHGASALRVRYELGAFRVNSNPFALLRNRRSSRHCCSSGGLSRDSTSPDEAGARQRPPVQDAYKPATGSTNTTVFTTPSRWN